MPFEPKRWSHRFGFTLIELVVTLAVLAVLAAIAVPVAELTYKRSKEQELRYSLRQIREGIDAYKRATDEGRIAKKAGESGYPPKLEMLSDGVEDLRSPTKAKIYFLRRIPSDPLAPFGVTGVESWGKRSYASPPDEPKAGDDVYDVYSLDPGTGINGIPYRQW
jgi:general secretion pathway protein G